MNPQDDSNHALPQIADDAASIDPAAVDPAAAPIVPVALPVNDDLIAEDVELIEKAWVEKAKAIVNRTQGDPYAQNEEMNKVKSEYLKKRYNKDLKADQ